MIYYITKQNEICCNVYLDVFVYVRSPLMYNSDLKVQSCILVVSMLVLSRLSMTIGVGSG